MRAHSPPRHAALKELSNFWGSYFYVKITLASGTKRLKSFHRSKVVIINAVHVVISMVVSSLWNRLLFCMQDPHQVASDSVFISESMWHDLYCLVISVRGLRVTAVIPNCNFVERKGTWATLRWQREINQFNSLLWQMQPLCNSRKMLLKQLDLLTKLSFVTWNWA